MRNFIVLLLIVFFAGCEAPVTYRAVALPKEPQEVPGANIPRQLRIRNWRGSAGEGSCVHATTKNALIWLNDFQGAANWKYENGEYGSALCQKLEKAGYQYLRTDTANFRYLEWASDLRLPAIIWWKPSHCCMFAGFAKGSDILRQYPGTPNINPSLEYAVILDNNHIDRYEFEEKSRFIRLWHGYGGFGVVLLKDPTTSMPYLSYYLE